MFMLSTSVKLNEGVKTRITGTLDLLLCGGHPAGIEVRGVHIEGLQTFGYPLADASHSQDAYGFVFQAMGTGGDFSDVPAAAYDFVVGGDVIAD